MSPGLRKGRKDQASVKMITCDLDVLPKMHIISISNPIEMLIYTYTDILSFSYPTKKSLIYYFNAVLLYGGTSLCHMVFTKHIEVGKISCLQWHVSSFELNMQLRDILHHFKPTAEAAASTSVFVHLILGQNTYKCFTTLGALPKHFFGFDVLSRSGQPQLSNLTGVYESRVEINPFYVREICPFQSLATPNRPSVHLLLRLGELLVQAEGQAFAAMMKTIKGTSKICNTHQKAIYIYVKNYILYLYI